MGAGSCHFQHQMTDMWIPPLGSRAWAPSPTPNLEGAGGRQSSRVSPEPPAMGPTTSAAGPLLLLEVKGERTCWGGRGRDEESRMGTQKRKQ